MLTLWIVVVVLAALEIFETVLLVLLLRALGEIRQNGNLSTNNAQSPNAWGLTVGEKAPAFTGTDQDGNTINFETYRDQRRVLVFVSPGCSVCADVIAAMNALLHEKPDIVMLAVGDSDVERNHAYAVEHHARMPILATPSHIDKELYRVQGVPFVFIIDETSTIRAKGIVNDSERLRTLLQSAFPPVTVAS